MQPSTNHFKDAFEAGQKARDNHPYIDPDKTELKVSIIEGAVCGYFNMTMNDVKLRSRVSKYRWPRQLLANFMSEYTTLSPTKIADHLGLERTTILYCSKVVRDMVDSNDPRKTDYDLLNRIVNEKITEIINQSTTNEK